MEKTDQLAERLAPHYSQFQVHERLLFTGHSHQAWPDVALEGIKEAYLSASGEVDTKWEQAFEKTEILRDYLRAFYDDPEGLYCRGESTHQLFVSWLSSFDLGAKPKIITTDSEFHSMYRQLSRLEEEGICIKRVNAHTGNTASLIARQLDEQTAAIMLSRVYFESGFINQHLTEIAALARDYNVPLLIDDYHGTNVVPLSLQEARLRDCYLLTGGYKYLQWGEGNCFLRYPRECNLRPAVTGWFASFDTLEESRQNGPVSYDDGNQRFASGTYDPISQFRAAKVVGFFRDHQLTPEKLRAQYQRQLRLLRQRFLEQDFDPSLIRLRNDFPLEQLGGFLSLRSPYAQTIRKELLKMQVYTDARGDILRLGPAPYISSRQILQVIEQLADVVERLNP